MAIARMARVCAGDAALVIRILFQLQVGRARDLARPPAFPADVVWIDMIEPTHEEESTVEKVLGIEVPTRDDLKDNRAVRRLYVERMPST